MEVNINWINPTGPNIRAQRVIAIYPIHFLLFKLNKMTEQEVSEKNGNRIGLRFAVADFSRLLNNFFNSWFSVILKPGKRFVK
jgi:hypothetical protein